MRKILYSAIACVLLLAGAILAHNPGFRAMAQNVACYMEQGGASWVLGSGCTQTVASGGTISVASGGIVNFASGSSLKFGGFVANVTANVVALDGSNPTSIQTGFTAITACSATLKTTTAPGLNTTTVTIAYSTGQLDIYAWKPTSGASPNLTASTGTESVAFTCVGG